jgi:hypothetical protein
MPRAKVRPGTPDRQGLETEIARLRDLDISQLQAKWQSVFRRRAPPHLPRHLLFKTLAYQLQADSLGDLDPDTSRLLDHGDDDAVIDRLAAKLNQRRTKLTPGTLLVREWNGKLHRVMVLADGFAWNDRIFKSLSKVAFALTGTRWNGPRFFGLRAKPSREARR